MICSKCKRTDSEVKFYEKRTEKRLTSLCKECFNNYCELRWTKTKQRAVDYLGGICMNCKRTYDLPVYQFHHKDPANKKFTWNKLRLKSWDSIVTELDKCELLCSNCHIMKHSKHYLNI